MKITEFSAGASLGAPVKQGLLWRLMTLLFGDPAKCRDCGADLPEKNSLCDACALNGQI